MNFRIVFLALFLTAGLASCSKLSGGGATVSVDPNKVRSLTVGMSQSEVKAALGDPSGTQEMKVLNDSLTTWMYIGEKDSANIVFDTQGKVTAVGLNGAALVGPAGE